MMQHVSVNYLITKQHGGKKHSLANRRFGHDCFLLFTQRRGTRFHRGDFPVYKQYMENMEAVIKMQRLYNICLTITCLTTVRIDRDCLNRV